MRGSGPPVRVGVFTLGGTISMMPLLRWKGGIIGELTVPLRRPQPSIRTDEDTIALLRRLAVHYPDTKIAGILNRQGRRTARGLSYTANRVASLRHHWNIPCHQPTDTPQEGEPLNVSAAARQLGIAASTLLRRLNDGCAMGRRRTGHPRPPHGASASPTNCATCSSTTPPTAGSPSTTPAEPSASPAKPCCRRSSAANCKPS